MLIIDIVKILFFAFIIEFIPYLFGEKSKVFITFQNLIATLVAFVITGSSNFWIKIGVRVK